MGKKKEKRKQRKRKKGKKGVREEGRKPEDLFHSVLVPHLSPQTRKRASLVAVALCAGSTAQDLGHFSVQGGRLGRKIANQPRKFTIKSFIIEFSFLNLPATIHFSVFI